MYKGRERRRYRRVSQPFMAEFRIQPKKTPKDQADSEWERTAVLNLGAGGLLFYCNKRIKIGSLLDLKISSFGRQAVVECIGKAVRVEKLSGSEVFLVAVVFKKIADKTKKAIEGIVKNRSLISPKRKN